MKGKIGVTTENIFPIIKKFLYSDQEIFIRELISNAVDATEKLKVLARKGEYKGDVSKAKIYVSIDKNKKAIKISDYGIGMTKEEVEKYINQVAFSGAQEFLSKYKEDINLIGHFGLGFYSAFIVASKVELITKSYKEGSQAVKWTCWGEPEYELVEYDRENHGTDVILYITEKDYEVYLNEDKIEELLKKYCKFLPVPIIFGKKKEYIDGKLIETQEDYVINITNPLWKSHPQNLKDEDYINFYKILYPDETEEPILYVHLNIDYPFNLQGILYFPKIKSYFDVKKRKIQLYCNQVFVTDNLEGIVADYLSILHGVIDSPDIPLNISRSYLQNDPQVKNISSYISKKVAEKLCEIFEKNRQEFENKWELLKLFIQFGAISDEKFYSKVKDIILFKNIDNKYFTLSEYEKVIKTNQTDKYKNLIILYTTNKDSQFTYIQQALDKGYDILESNGYLDIPLFNLIEQKEKYIFFKRVDADLIDKLIEKDDYEKIDLNENEQENLRVLFTSLLPDKNKFFVKFERSNTDMPLVIIQNEFLRRISDMAQYTPSPIYDKITETYTLVVNINHNLFKKVKENFDKTLSNKLNEIHLFIKNKKEEIESLRSNFEKNKEQIENIEKEIEQKNLEKNTIIQNYANECFLLHQLIDITLLSNNLLTGNRLYNFIKRSLKHLDESYLLN